MNLLMTPPPQDQDWEFNFAYNRVRHLLKNRFGTPGLPGLDTMLFLIGVQELGRWRTDFTKEEKRDLMHIAVCRLLSYDGHYEFGGRDADGWPHFSLIKPVPKRPLDEQEALLKRHIVQYFDDLEKQEGQLD